MYSVKDQELAEGLRERADAATGFRPSNLEHGRELLWFEVWPHSYTESNRADSWGLWPVWRYADRPPPVTSSRNGGPFVPLAEVPEWAAIEAERRTLYRDSMLESFVSTALQDAQLSESDEACGEEREARDVGTIYTIPARTLERLRQIVESFRADCAAHIESALDLEPGEDGLQYRRGSKAGAGLSDEELGSTLWLAVTGTGVTFTDDGDSPALQAMADWARANGVEGLYIGDSGGAYLC